jgi:hypothetical protein
MRQYGEPFTIKRQALDTVLPASADGPISESNSENQRNSISGLDNDKFNIGRTGLPFYANEQRVGEVASSVPEYQEPLEARPSLGRHKTIRHFTNAHHSMSRQNHLP